MMDVKGELNQIIRNKFRSEAECARKIGWSRQRLNKITTGNKVPDVDELNRIASAVERNPEELLHIFLAQKSTNGQQKGRGVRGNDVKKESPTEDGGRFGRNGAFGKGNE